MLPKCTSSRFASQGKRTESTGIHGRKNHTSWYSASHVELAQYGKDQNLCKWDWTDQSMWDWQGGNIVEHASIHLFDDLEEFDFNNTKTIISKMTRKGLTIVPKIMETPYEVDKIIGKRELTPRAIEYQVKWVGYPNKKDRTWEPIWRLKADVPKLVKSYERAQRDIKNAQKDN